MADGGHKHYQDLADETGRDVATIYRALQELDALLENDNGVVSWRSKKLHQEIAGVVDRVEDVVGAGAEATARLLGMEPQQLNEAGSALQRWLNEYAAEVVDRNRTGRQALIKVRSVLSRFRGTSGTWIGEALRELEQAWLRADQPIPFEDVTVEYRTGSGTARIRGAELYDLESPRQTGTPSGLVPRWRPTAEWQHYPSRFVSQRYFRNFASWSTSFGFEPAVAAAPPIASTASAPRDLHRMRKPLRGCV